MIHAHTPGPWRQDGPDMFGDFNILPAADALAIAAAVTNLRPREQVAANARLIAAAPELLDVLTICRDRFDYYAEQHMAKTPPDEAKADVNRRMVERCNAAIAKATGDA